MSTSTERTGARQAINLLKLPAASMTTDAVLHDFVRYFGRTLGRQRVSASSPYIYQALAFAVRDRLVDRWNLTNRAQERSHQRRACYLSLEFLMGRLLRNSILNLDIEEECHEALSRLGLSFESVEECEQDAGLGNGGLGRLAACFLDSCATLGLPVTGYGIRYAFGMFHQHIENGHQVEDPDPWLRNGFPWEIRRHELAQTIHFGGRCEIYQDARGHARTRWVDTHDVLAVPFDVLIPGFRNDIVNTLRLWSAMPTEAFDLEEFNAGDYTDAVAEKNAAENITMVLYPNAASESGKDLRLRQQYFLASASLKDILRDWMMRHGRDFTHFADKHCFQLNDTHPAVAVAELMRLLLDDHGLDWEEAWEITTSTMAYTNHTLLPEALEMWPVRMFERLLPRLLQIIFEINARFLREVEERWPGDPQRQRRMSLIYEDGEPQIRMAYLAIVGSFSVNGVAELHSQLLRAGMFHDFAEMWPERFNNKTNGVTQRRWLAACNPRLSALIGEKIGDGWMTDLEQLHGLAEHASDPDFQDRWRGVKQANKRTLAKSIHKLCHLTVDPGMLFDVQVKRIHEYKRQLLNTLHAVHLYDRIRRGDIDGMVPRCIIIGGKAAPGYWMAKRIIKLINNVAGVINTDPAADGLLRLVFVPDYNVSKMEIICPAADLSAQISTAGKEASGTGNMKFMLNGALTIGTLDGANVEIREAVGADNFFLFGLNVDEVTELRSQYDPAAIIAADRDFRRVIDLLRGGHFSRFEGDVLEPVIASIEDPRDTWMTAADFRSFVDTQQRVAATYLDSAAWLRMSILNSAAAGRFSTDRTMREYNRDIWRLDPIALPPRG